MSFLKSYRNWFEKRTSGIPEMVRGSKNNLIYHFPFDTYFRHPKITPMVQKMLLSLVIVCQVAYGQTVHESNKSKPFAFLDSLLKKDNYTAEFLDFEYPKDILEITMRFQKTIAEKKEWYQEYFSKNYKEGEGMPYNENFGITKEEYQKIKDLNKTPPTIVVRRTALLKTNRNSNIFSFTASANDLKFLESLKIDFRNEVVTFMNDTIPFSSEINAPGTTPFGEWHGYSWIKETSNQAKNDDLQIDSLIGKIIEIDFGTIKKNNKIFLRLKYKSLNKGKFEENLDSACYLN
jgi:hypothetical protein